METVETMENEMLSNSKVEDPLVTIEELKSEELGAGEAAEGTGPKVVKVNVNPKASERSTTPSRPGTPVRPRSAMDPERPHLIVEFRRPESAKVVSRANLTRDEHINILAQPQVRPRLSDVYVVIPTPVVAITPRIEELARPNLRYVRALLDEFEEILSPKLIERLKKLLSQDFASIYGEASEYSQSHPTTPSRTQSGQGVRPWTTGGTRTGRPDSSGRPGAYGRPATAGAGGSSRQQGYPQQRGQRKQLHPGRSGSQPRNVKEEWTYALALKVAEKLSEYIDVIEGEKGPTLRRQSLEHCLRKKLESRLKISIETESEITEKLLDLLAKEMAVWMDSVIQDMEKGEGNIALTDAAAEGKVDEIELSDTAVKEGEQVEGGRSDGVESSASEGKGEEGGPGDGETGSSIEGGGEATGATEEEAAAAEGDEASGATEEEAAAAEGGEASGATEEEGAAAEGGEAEEPGAASEEGTADDRGGDTGATAEEGPSAEGEEASAEGVAEDIAGAEGEAALGEEETGESGGGEGEGIVEGMLSEEEGEKAAEDEEVKESEDQEMEAGEAIEEVLADSGASDIPQHVVGLPHLRLTASMTPASVVAVIIRDLANMLEERYGVEMSKTSDDEVAKTVSLRQEEIKGFLLENANNYVKTLSEDGSPDWVQRAVEAAMDHLAEWMENVVTEAEKRADEKEKLAPATERPLTPEETGQWVGRLEDGVNKALKWVDWLKEAVDAAELRGMQCMRRKIPFSQHVPKEMTWRCCRESVDPKFGRGSWRREVTNRGMEFIQMKRSYTEQAEQWKIQMESVRFSGGERPRVNSKNGRKDSGGISN